MSQPQSYQQSTGQPSEPRDDLDVAYSIIRPSEYNDLLKQVNFGTGYYEDEELRLQMSNGRKGLVTDIAFSKTLRDHAEQETMVKLADEGFEFATDDAQVKIWEAYEDIDDSEYEAQGRTAILLERGEEIWHELARPDYALSIEQAAALEAKAGLSEFKPIFHHLTAMYHEQTKSKGARTQDNYFGRVNRHEVNNTNGQPPDGSRLPSLGSK